MLSLLSRVLLAFMFISEREWLAPPVVPWGNTNRVVSNRVVSKGPLYPSKTKSTIFFCFLIRPRLYASECPCPRPPRHESPFGYTRSPQQDSRLEDFRQGLGCSDMSFSLVAAKIFQGLGPKRRESSNGDRVYIQFHYNYIISTM